MFVEALNKFYLAHNELWEADSDWSGFKWISSDDNENSVIVFRRFNRMGEEIVVVCNFQPKAHEEYSFGVPYYADYEEIFSTEKREFGGSGLTNKTVKSEAMPMHNEAYSITIKIAPMSAMFFKAKNIRTPEDDERKTLQETAKKGFAKKTEKTEEKKKTEDTAYKKAEDKGIGVKGESGKTVKASVKAANKASKSVNQNNKKKK